MPSEVSENIYPIIDKYILYSELLDFCTSTSGINILHVNCRSLKKHFSELQILLNNCVDKILAVVISETWLNKLNEFFFKFPVIILSPTVEILDLGE